MSKDCCRPDTATIETTLEAEESGGGHYVTTMPVTLRAVNKSCVSCRSQSRAVSRKTLLLMLKPELLDHGLTGAYRFCSTPHCAVVYFDEETGCVFTTEDLRVRVGLKVDHDPIPLCYCFGFDESHIREEIVRTEKTTIPERISVLIREGLCACESRNPSGVCCLGEVNRVAKKLMNRETRQSQARVQF